VASEDIVNYLEQNLDRHVAAIQELVRQPSVSPERLGGQQYAELLREHYLGIGCREAGIADTGDAVPGVWAFLDGGAPHTIACYSYFDTYGVDAAAWDFPPFGGTRVSFGGFADVVVGRGATVKGSHRTLLNALEAVREVEGSLPVNILFLSEGAEMLGSPNFDAICTAASIESRDVEAFFSPRMAERLDSNEIPVVLGYKNMVTFDLVCRADRWGRGPVGGTVYGNSKAVVDAPTHRLIQALATMIGPDGNRIAIDGLATLNDEPVALSDEEETLMNQLREHFAGGPWNAALPTTAGVSRWAGDLEGADLLRAYLYAPSINISAIRSAGIGDTPQLTMLLPDTASASVELRLVTEMPATQVIELVRKHLVAHDFPEVEVVPAGVWDGQRISTQTPIVHAALETLTAYGRAPLIWPIQPFGGPWAGAAERLGVPSLSGCALGYGAGGGGAANEFYVIESEHNVAGLLAAETYLVDLVANVGKQLVASTAEAARG
jgi:acetylornithine deacetylase/succinyl-diaminopimelate desuccinylase-like protein